MATTTPGRALAAEIRTMYQLNARSRWGSKRRGRIVRVDRDLIIEDIRGTISEYRGIESTERTAILDTAHTALCAWGKFVDGFRIDGVLRFHIIGLSPAGFAAFLGDMVDSGCSNMGEFEVWFAAKAREVRAAG